MRNGALLNGSPAWTKPLKTILDHLGNTLGYSNNLVMDIIHENSCESNNSKSFSQYLMIFELIGEFLSNDCFRTRLFKLGKVTRYDIKTLNNNQIQQCDIAKNNPNACKYLF